MRSRLIDGAFAFLSRNIYNFLVSGRNSRKEKAIRMFRRIAGFFRRLFNSKGFQRSFRIFLGVYAAYYIYNVILFIKVAMDIGASFGEALRFYFSLPFLGADWVTPSAGIALGIAIGLAWAFNRKRTNRETDEPEEKLEGSSGDAREEETIETTHYKYQ